MVIFDIFSVIKEVLGLAKPYVDEKEKKKNAVADAMKVSATQESPSIQGADAHQEYRDELKNKNKKGDADGT